MIIDIINEFIDIEKDECDKLWQEIKTKHELNLSIYNVKLPTENTSKYYQLIYLYKYINCLVKKDVIADFVISKIPSAGKDQQVRHLAADGFNLIVKGGKIINTDETVPSGYYLLQTLDFPKPEFMAKSLKRVSLLKVNDFEKIKKIYNNRCATCGSKEGEPHRVSGKLVELQQGHMDPNRPLEVGNIIPQCQYCNQNIYKDFFVFNEDGYPIKISNPEFVLRSDKYVRRQIYELIKKKDKII